MTPNKFLALIICLILGVYIYFDRQVAVEEFADFGDEDTKIDSKKSKLKKDEVVRKFAQSIAENPEILNTVADSSTSLTPQQALDNLLNEGVEPTNFEMHNLYKDVLSNKKQDSLPLIFSRYLNLENTEDQSEKQKLLDLAVELCNNEANAACSDFLYTEALNKNLESYQQLAAFKGFLNTKDVSTEEKLEFVSAFRLSNPNPDLKAELDNIEQYVRNHNQFIVPIDSTSGDQDRSPASMNESIEHSD